MKKGVTLLVKVYVEGEDEPAHDFAQVGTQITTQMFQTAFKAFAAPYTFQVLKITPVEGDDDSDESDSASVAPLLQYTPQASAKPATPAQQSPTASVPPPQSGPTTGPKRTPGSQQR